MQIPFSSQMQQLAQTLNIGLYQRLSIDEASSVLSLSKEKIKLLLRNKQLNSLPLENQQIEFFGHQIVQYLLLYRAQSSLQPINDNSVERIIRASELQKITGLSRTTLWRLENKGDFPRRIKLGAGSVGWRNSEVTQWIEQRCHA